MVNGQLRCLGTSQHLKNRFGQGFELEIMTVLPAPEAVAAQLAQLRTRAPHLVTAGDDENALLAVGLNDASICAALGRPDRGSLVEVGDAGSSLRQAAAATDDGRVGALLFCEWWLSEDVGDRLHEWLCATFGEVELLVRAHTHRTIDCCRFEALCSILANRHAIAVLPNLISPRAPHSVRDGRNDRRRTHFGIVYMPAVSRWATCLGSSRMQRQSCR